MLELRQIIGIKWQDKIPNTEVLERCKMTGIEAFLRQAQLCWSGHLVRMPDTRLPKAIFYSQLSSDSIVCGRPVKRYKDSLKKSLQLCNIDSATWETTTQDRSLWRHSCVMGISSFERQGITDLQLKRARRKAVSTSLHSLTTAPSVDENVLPPSDYTHT